MDEYEKDVDMEEEDEITKVLQNHKECFICGFCMTCGLCKCEK